MIFENGMMFKYHNFPKFNDQLVDGVGIPVYRRRPHFQTYHKSTLELLRYPKHRFAIILGWKVPT